MFNEITALVENYPKWLRDNTDIKIDDDSAEITTPFLDRHNDCLQVYAREGDGGYILSDDGYIIDDLMISGCKLTTTKRQDLLNLTLAGFGVKNKHGELRIEATADDFALKQHNLIQAMLAVNDLFYLVPSSIPSVEREEITQPQTITRVFHENVTGWLDKYDIRFTPEAKLQGKSGFDHMFDFAVPKTKTEPERFLEAITKPTKKTAQALAFAWLDTDEARDSDSRAFAILNDQKQYVSADIKNALEEYNIFPFCWSEREEYLPKLAA